jgi:hypothetical protein
MNQSSAALFIFCPCCGVITHTAIAAPVSINKTSGVNRNDSVILQIKQSSALTMLALAFFMIHPLRCLIAGQPGHV